MKRDQLPDRFRIVVEREVEIFQGSVSVSQQNGIPDTAKIPIENPFHWLRIPDVISVFVDMKGSTTLSATTHERSTAAVYRLFTGTAVALFHEFESPYIDVRGDGVFALFDSWQIHRALSAAVTFKTFCVEEFLPKTKAKADLHLGVHLGIDQKTVLVRKLGLKAVSGRTDRQNEVWAGRPVNISAKLASLSQNNELYVSERFFGRLRAKESLKTCGCPTGSVTDLWSSIDLSEDDRFDFQTAYVLKSNWCQVHGSQYCEALLSADRSP
jgi:class 3 adenylate cyclase